jgi:hypothetical protein
VLGSTKGRILSYFAIKIDDDQCKNPWPILYQPSVKYELILGYSQAGWPQQSHSHIKQVSGH